MDVGYALIAKKIESSELYRKKPLEWRCIWIHWILNVNYTDSEPIKGLPPGAGYFSYSGSKDKLRGVTESQWQKCINWCRKNGMIKTAKRARGVIIQLTTYPHWQDPQSYAKKIPDPTLGLEAGSESPPAKPARRREKVYPEGFNALWDPWPRHKSKKDAFMELKMALRRAPFETIKNGHAAALEAIKKGTIEAKQLPELFRWLRADRWEDEYATTPTPSPRNAPEQANREDQILNVIERLYAEKDNPEEFARALKVSRNKHRDVPPNDKGERITAEALRRYKENMEYQRERQKESKKV